MESPPAVDAQAVCLSYADRPDAGVKAVSLSVKRGEIVGLLGLNGAGKSTTLRLLAGVRHADSGTIRVDGHCLDEEPLQARRASGYLADTPPLYNDMIVSAYLTLCARLNHVARGDITARVTEVMTQCDLTDVASQRIRGLSKGYRQRVGLAQAIVHQPALLLLDEPSNGLDPQQTQAFRTLLQSLSKTCGIIFSTHLLAEVQQVCDRVAVMHNGRIVHDQSLAHSTEASDGGDQALRNLEHMFQKLVTERDASAP